jgi:hypothetical protein
VRICVSSPYRVNNVPSHLLNSTNTNIFVLKFLLLTIYGSNLLINIHKWSLRNRFLNFIDYHMAGITHRISYFKRRACKHDKDNYKNCFEHLIGILIRIIALCNFNFKRLFIKFNDEMRSTFLVILIKLVESKNFLLSSQFCFLYF